MLFWETRSISAHSFELAQTPNFENHIDILVSYPFPEIELENEYDPKSQLCNSILLPVSIMTLVSSPNFNPSLELTLDPVPIIEKLNHQSFMIIILNLTNFILLKVLLTNWQVIIFMKLNSMRNVT